MPRVGPRRPRISVFIAQSLDGYIADVDDRLEWLTERARDDEEYGFADFLAACDRVAMGRRTYEVIKNEKELPYQQGSVEVFSAREFEVRRGFSVVHDTVEQAVERWAEEGVKRVYVDGGALISSFLRFGLVDDLTITIAPVLLGRGTRLFHPIEAGTYLRLVKSEAYESGMVQLRYERE